MVVAKTLASKPAARRTKPLRVNVLKAGAEAVPPDNDAIISKERFEAVMQAARQSGLLGEKAGRIGGRVSPALVEQAKRQTGIETDTDLIEFALASVALEDRFAEAFKEARGKIDPGLKLGF